MRSTPVRDVRNIHEYYTSARRIRAVQTVETKGYKSKRCTRHSPPIPGSLLFIHASRLQIPRYLPVSSSDAHHFFSSNKGDSGWEEEDTMLPVVDVSDERRL
jgi:hypothetical protein